MDAMAQIEGSARDQLYLGSVFRRITQATSVSPVAADDLAEQIDRPASQPGSIPNQHFVSNVTERNAPGQKEQIKPQSRLIIAVDFGTTYSTVSYAKIKPGIDSTKLSVSKIHCINDYENAVGSSDARASARADNVPTKLLYLEPGAPDTEQTETDTDPENDCLSDVDVERTATPDSNIIRRKRGRKPFASSSKQKPRTTWSRKAGVTVCWGFSVQYVQKDPFELAKYKKEVVELIKLTLGEDANEDIGLQDKRAKLTKQIKTLELKRIIQDRNHLLCDYLARLLRHAKAMLKEDGLLEATTLEYVLCVPVSWSQNACRTMHDAMVKAVQACKLDVLERGLIPELFIVSEPEAAAQYVMASLGGEGRLKQGEVFIILDAGGGTVDITTYKVTSNDTGPLRLQGEVVAPDGALCGSSLITERYLSKIRAKLEEIDPTGNPDILDGLATTFANQWDMFDKPRIDITNKKTMGLKLGGKKYHNYRAIEWTEEEIREIFEPSLKKTTELLENQLQLAKEKNLIVNKLVVVGGFGESPSLRARIRRVLSASCNGNGEEIEAIWPKTFPTSAVARGAVLRALDKRNGPSRISRSSFGFLRHEPYKQFPEHEEANVVAKTDGIDRDEFVRDTIYWQLQAGDELKSPYKTEPVLSCHTFAPSDFKLICVEKLYVSQRRHRSHFQCNHPENRAADYFAYQGASLLSYVEVDVSDLKTKFPLEDKANVGPRTKASNRFIRVAKFDLVIDVEGKQLKYEVRWPPGASTPEEVQFRKSGYVSLAPSFAPGTE